MAKKIDSILVVARGGKVTRTTSKQAVEKLGVIRDKVLGVVLNGVIKGEVITIIINNF